MFKKIYIEITNICNLNCKFCPETSRKKESMSIENFEEAMRYFELGKNRVYYSKAYKQYRDGIIRQWFTPVLVTVVVLIAGSYAYKTIKNKKLGIKKEEETGVGDE